MSEAVAVGSKNVESQPAALERLDGRVMRLWRMSLAIWSLSVVLTALALGIVTGSAVVLGAAALAIAVLAALVVARWPRARYEAWGYVVRDSDLVLRHGVLWKVVSVVPLARIQHVDTRRGPLERAAGLATVAVHTAGSVGAVLTIPGLDAAQAERLRDRLAALSGVTDAV